MMVEDGMPAEALRPDDPPLRETLFCDADLKVGLFRACPQHPRFRDSGPARHHVFVFPRSAVWIKHPSTPAFVADANVATLYNRGRRYRREAIDPRGDRSLWFAPSERRLAETFEELEVPWRHDTPFRRHARRVGARAYALQAALARYLRSSTSVDPLAVEETALTLLEHLIADRGKEASSSPPRRHRDLAEAARCVIDRRFDERLSLGALARLVGCSPSHLCRVFRATAGRSIHSYRDQIRLREALHRLELTETPLTELALDLGYDSHSHFTARFSAAFGVPPSSFRSLPYEVLHHRLGRPRRARS